MSEIVKKVERIGPPGPVFTLGTANSVCSMVFYARISGIRANPLKYTDPDGKSDEEIAQLVILLYLNAKSKQNKNEIDEFVAGVGDGLISSFFRNLDEKLRTINKNELDRAYESTESRAENGEKTIEPRTNGQIIVDKIDKMISKTEAFLNWNNKPKEE